MIPTELLPLVVLLALVPGYLTIYLATRNSTLAAQAGDLRTVLQSLAVSVFLQAFLSPLTVKIMYPIRDELIQHPIRVTGWLVVSFLVAPVVVAVVTPNFRRLGFPPSELVTTSRVKRVIRWFISPSPPPTLFDWAMTAGVMEGRFVLIQYEDGR